VHHVGNFVWSKHSVYNLNGITVGCRRNLAQQELAILCIPKLVYSSWQNKCRTMKRKMGWGPTPMKAVQTWMAYCLWLKLMK